MRQRRRPTRAAWPVVKVKEKEQEKETEKEGEHGGGARSAWTLYGSARSAARAWDILYAAVIGGSLGLDDGQPRRGHRARLRRIIEWGAPSTPTHTPAAEPSSGMDGRSHACDGPTATGCSAAA